MRDRGYVFKSIEIHGFKSFANKIVFQFHNGITGIVGPNGSGKSNVAGRGKMGAGRTTHQAVAWCQHAGCYFLGNRDQKTVELRLVAITLSTTAITSWRSTMTKLTVARRIYRSGESEYLINGTPGRLKDVNEMFYDTGIGKEGYSIIGQGPDRQDLKR